jgi:hypothetical protein
VYDDSVARAKSVPIDTSVVAINMYSSTVVFSAQTKSEGASECIVVVTMFVSISRKV